MSKKENINPKRKCKVCGGYIPWHITVNGKRRNLQERSMCLECSPFRSGNTKHAKTLIREKRGIIKYCNKCGEEDQSKFANCKTRICKSCHNKYVSKNAAKKRKAMLEELGEKCIICGYSLHQCSLDTHHIDPTKKSKSFDRWQGWNLEKIFKEIENCVLMCRNCHHAYHNGLFCLLEDKTLVKDN